MYIGANNLDEEKPIKGWSFRNILNSSDDYLELKLYNDESPFMGEPTLKEVNYKNYNSVRVLRSPLNWEIEENLVKNKKEIIFPKCTGGKIQVDYCKVFLDGKEIHNIPITKSLIITEGQTPKFLPNNLIIEEFQL